MVQYRREHLIGRGGFGNVYEIVDTPYAQKVCSATADSDDIARFARGVRMQARLHHKHVVPIVSYDLDARPPHLLCLKPFVVCANIKRIMPI